MDFMEENQDKQRENYFQQGKWLALGGFILFIAGLFLHLSSIILPGFFIMCAGAIVIMTNLKKKS
jgi:hypothetical protein